MELDKLEVVITADDSDVSKDLEAVLAKFNAFYSKLKKQAKENANAIQDSFESGKGTEELSKSFAKFSKDTAENFKNLANATKQLSERMDSHLSNSTSKAKSKVGKDVADIVRDVEDKMKQANTKQNLIGELKTKRNTLANSGDTLGVAKIDEQIARLESAMKKLHQSAVDSVEDMKREFDSLPQSMEEVAKAMEKNEHKIYQAKSQLKDMQERDPRYMRDEARHKHEKALFAQQDRVDKLIAENDRLMNVYANMESRSLQLKSALEGVNTELAKQKNLTENLQNSAPKATPRKFGRSRGVQSPHFDKMQRTAEKIRKPVGEFKKANGILGRFGKMKAPRMNFSPFRRGGNILSAFTRRLLIAGLAYKTFKSMASYVGGAIAMNEQLASSLNSIQVNLATAFYPIIQAVIPILQTLISWLATAIGWLASFISLLFGTTVSASRAGAKAMTQAMGGVGESAGDAADDTEDAAKKMKQSFLGIDEINTLDQDDDDDKGKGKGKGGKGGGGPAGAWDWDIPEPELPKWLTNMLDKIKPFLEKMKKLFTDGFKSAFNPSGIDKMMQAFQRIGKNLQEIFTNPKLVNAFSNFIDKTVYASGQKLGALANIGLSIAENLVGGFDLYLENYKGYIIDRFTNIFDSMARINELDGMLWEAIGRLSEVFRSDSAMQITSDIIAIFVNAGLGIVDVFLKIKTDMTEMMVLPITENLGIIQENFQGFVDALVPIYDSIADGVTHAFSSFSDVYTEHISPFFDGMTNSFIAIVGLIGESWKANIQPILTEFGNKFKEVYEAYAKPAIDNMMSLIGLLGDKLQKLWNGVVDPFLRWIASNILPTLAPIFKAIGDIFLELFKLSAKIFNDIIDVMKGLLEFVDNVFSGNWEGAMNAMGQVVEAFGSLFANVFGGLANIFRSAINGVIGLINGFIGGLNQIKLPDFLGGFSVSLPYIPYLAKGGIVDSPTLAMVGEAGKEAVMPLENNTGWMSVLAHKLAELMPQPKTPNAPMGDIVVQIGDREFGRFAINEINREQERAGRTLLYV